jgi:3-deoxy-D-manno-octulosonate 8-phosphate phosphatase (KDO 8-P phosphatase)
MKLEIRAIAFDFDGVFTDNRVIVSEEGKEFVTCSRADGLGISILKDLGIPMKIISSESNPVVTRRAEKLNLPIVQSVEDKSAELKLFSEEIGIDLKYIAFVGNDINDLECMQQVGFPVAVADAVNQIKQISSINLNAAGGKGAVRELCDMIVKYRNK